MYLGANPDGTELRHSKVYRARDGFDHSIEGRRRAEDAWAREVERVASTPIAAVSMTVADLVRRFIEARVEGGPDRTVAGYRWSETLIADTIGAIPITELTVRDVEWMLIRLADNGDGLAKSSLVKVRSHLGRALKHAQRDAWVTRNVAELAEIPRQTADTKKRRSLSIDEAQKFLRAAAEHQLHAALVLGMTRALRPGELLGLQWHNLDLGDGQGLLRVRESLVKQDGQWTIGPLKRTATRAKRDLDLNGELVELLEVQRGVQDRLRSKAGQHWDGTWDNVFSTRSGTLIALDNFRRTCTTLCRHAGIPRYTPYEILRHTGLSILAELEVPDRDLIDLAGHETERMLNQHYRHRLSNVNAGIDRITSTLLP